MRVHRRSGRVNLRLLALLAAGAILAAAGAFAARQLQVRGLAERARVDGLAAYARADWAEAARQLSRYLRRSPEDFDVLGKYADANLRIRPADHGTCLAAADALHSQFKLRPDDGQTFERLARLTFGLRDFAELERFAQRRLATAAGDRQARIWLGRAQLGRRAFDEAQATLTALASELQGDPAALNDYGDVCVLLSAAAERAHGPDAPDAMRWLDSILAVLPDCAAACVHRARLSVALAAQPAQADRAPLERRARDDLARYDSTANNNPELRLIAAIVWSDLGVPDAAAAELAAADALGAETIAAAFPVTSDWLVARCHAAATLSTHQMPAPQDVAWIDAALAQLKTRAERAPVLPDAVRVLCRAGRVTEAQSLLAELEQSLPMLSTADAADELAFLKAIVARAAGDEHAAINALEPLSLRNSAPLGVWALLAEAYARTGQAERAAAALTQYLRLAPGDAAAQATLAQVYARLHDWRRALDAVRPARAARPDDLDLALLQIEATLELASQQDAAKHPAELEQVRIELERLRAAAPQRVEIRVLQANLALQSGDLPGAERELRRALVDCKDSLPAAIELIQFLHRGNRKDEALAAARETAERYPQRGVPQQLLAELLLAYGDGPGAVAALRAACERMDAGPERGAAEMKLALVELHSGARADGAERLRRIAAESTHDARPLGLLLSLPETRANAADAQALVEGIKRIEGEAGLGWRAEQAALWLEAPDWRTHEEDAVRLLNRCIEADSTWDRPVLLLGDLHEREGRLDLAEALYRRWLNMNGGAAEIADRLLTLLDRTKRVADQQELLRSLSLPESALYGWRLTLALHARDFEQAADVLRLRMSNDAGDAAARVLMARLVFQQTNDVDRALAYLDEAEAIAGDRTSIVATRIAVLEAAGRTDDALRLLAGRVERRRDFESLWMRGAFLLRLGRVQDAEADYQALPTAVQDARGHEILGAFYDEQGRTADALAAWEDGLRRQPDSADVAGRLARALLTRSAPGDRERAGEIAADIERRRPDDPDALVLRANCLLLDPADAAVAQAVALLERAVRLNPRGAEGHLALIRVALNEGAATRARDLATLALGAAGDDPRLFVARAEAELMCGNGRLARELARSALLRQPRDDGAFDVLASATVALGDDALLRETIDELQRLPATGPSAARRALALARLLTTAGRGDEAIALLQGTVTAGGDQRDVAVLLALTELHARRGEFAAAGATIERAAAVDPESPAVLQARVLWLGAQLRHADVIAAVSAAPEAARDWPQVLFAAGAELSSSPDLEHRRFAADLLARALARLPARSAVRLDVAAQLYGVGAIDSAEAVFRDALEREPDNARALNDLAWLLAEGRGQFDEALRMADRGVTLDSDNVDLRDTRGYILMRMATRLADARADFELCRDRARPGSPARARALLKTAQACHAMWDPAAAARNLNQALEIDQVTGALSTEERATAQRLLAELGPSAQ